MTALLERSAPVDRDPATDTDEPADDGEARARTPGRWVVAVGIAIVVAVVLQHPGQLTHETRLDLLLDPSGFLSGTWHLWDPSADMGRVQNQAVGYLFPMGPVLWLGHVAHVPPWLVERAWVALVLVAALWGVVRLADALRIGRPSMRLVAAASYALSPFVISRVGTTSPFVIAAALLPWVLVPLVRGARSGSPRRAAALAGLAVVAMGGVNAAVTAGALVVPALWLATRGRGPRRRSLVLWSLLSLVLASAWWAGPLVLQGRYGIDFLPFTERASTTTAFTSPLEVLRGTSDWLTHVQVPGTPVPAGAIAGSQPLVIAVSALLAAVGLAGLARRDLPERRFLVTSLLVGVAVVGIGYGGVLGNPGAGLTRDLLDGPLAAFRSVSKFQPVVVLPIALGLAHATSVAVDWLDRRTPIDRREVRRVVAAVAGVAIVLAATPLVTGDLLDDDGFGSVPSWWSEARDHVAATPGRALLLPGLPQSDSFWGYTGEEPFEWGDAGEWATRSLAPLGSVGATRFLDAVEAEIERGGDPALADTLRQAGFSTVVVRNDGAWQRYGAPSPSTVNRAVLDSGLEHEAGFGPHLLVAPEPGTAPLELQQVDVYRVPGTEDWSWTTTTDLDDAAVVSGGAGTALTLQQVGLGSVASVLSLDATDADPDSLPAARIVTDGNRRRFTNFGTNRDNTSHVLAPGDPGPAGTDVQAGLLPDDTLEQQTVAARTGIASVTASSSGSWASAVPEVAPPQAIDGDPATAWTSAAGRNGEGEWLQVEFDEPVDTDTIGLQLLDDGPWRPRVETLTVTTAAGSATTATVGGEGEQPVAVPPGPTTWMRLTVDAVTQRAADPAGVGIRELTVPGLPVDERLEVPPPFPGGADRLPTYVFQRSTSEAASVLRTDEERTLRRRFTVPASGELVVDAQVSAEPGPELLDLLDTSMVLEVDARSTLGDLPGFAPRNLVDHDDGSLWIAADPPTGSDATTAEEPDVALRWAGPRTLSELHLVTVPGYSSPASVRIEADGEVRQADVGDDGWVRFDPLTTDHVDIWFPTVARYAVSTGRAQPDVKPLALAGLEIDALDDLALGPLDRDHPVVVDCDAGPAVTVAGQTRRFRIETTAAELAELSTIDAEPCDTAPLPVDAGVLDLDGVAGDSPFVVTSAVLRDPSTEPPTDAAPRTAEVVSWGQEDRTVRVGEGDAAVLRIPENANEGWTATLDGASLAAVTLDGWQQGFVLPAGSGGDVTLRYAPTAPYRASLVVGALLVVALLGLALVPARRSGPPPVEGGRWPTWLAVALPVVCVLAIGGIGVIALVPLVVVHRRRPRTVPLLVAGALTLAGLVAATTTAGAPGGLAGPFGLPATALAVLAVVGVAATTIPATPGLDRRRRAAVDRFRRWRDGTWAW